MARLAGIARRESRERGEARSTSVHLGAGLRELRCVDGCGYASPGELCLCPRCALIGNTREQMLDEVETCPALVVRSRNEPGCPRGIRCLEHLVARAGVIIPTSK